MRQAHRQSWITESDFQMMAAAGINTIRFGVGWWVLAQTAVECQPMVEGGYRQVRAGTHPVCGTRTSLTKFILTLS